MSVRVCLDASAALAFALQDEPLHEQGKAMVRRFVANNVALCAPPLFLYECESIIRLRVYKGAMTEEEADEARLFIRTLSVEIEHNAADTQRAYEIARDYHQPRVYDSLYAAFAETRGLELVTLDKPFFEAVNGSKRPKGESPLGFVKLMS